MSFGFPAYSQSTRNFSLMGQELVAVVDEALRILHWPHQNESPNVFTATIPVSLWSWGERLTVHVVDNGNVTVRSECIFPLQCVDWGRNGWNVSSFFDEVSHIAAARIKSGTTIGDPLRAT